MEKRATYRVKSSIRFEDWLEEQMKDPAFREEWEKQARLPVLVGFVPEYRFDPIRRWRFDWAMPSIKLAVELEGGTWANGRHVRGKGYENDCRKYNAAALQGWRVLRFTSEMVDDGTLEETVKQAVKGKEGER